MDALNEEKRELERQLDELRMGGLANASRQVRPKALRDSGTNPERSVCVCLLMFAYVRLCLLMWVTPTLHKSLPNPTQQPFP